MEVLILALAPVMVAFTVALLGWVPPGGRPAALLGVIFMSLCAVVTCSVHFSVLTLSRQPLISAAEWAPRVFAFTWPSVAFAGLFGVPPANMDIRNTGIIGYVLLFPVATVLLATRRDSLKGN